MSFAVSVTVASFFHRGDLEPDVAAVVADRFVHREAVALDRGLGVEDEVVVVLFGSRFDLNGDVRGARGRLRILEFELVDRGALRVFDYAELFDLAQIRPLSVESPTEVGNPFGQNEVTRRGGRIGEVEPQGRHLVDRSQFEPVAGAYVDACGQIELIRHGLIERNPNTRIHRRANDPFRDDLLCENGEVLFAAVALFGPCRRVPVARFDRDFVASGHQIEVLGHVVERRVAADQTAVRLVDADQQIVQRIVLPTGCGGCRFDPEVHDAFAADRCVVLGARRAEQHQA